MSTEYWAASGPDKIAKEIMSKVTDYRLYLSQSGILGDLRKSFNMYYGATDIEDVDQSLKAIHVNHYASYIRNIQNMVTSSRPAWETQAVNTDLASQSDTQLAGSLLDYYMREKHIETQLTDAVLKALFLKEGWISLGWDVNGGKDYGVNPETQQPIKEGDFVVDSHTLIDITRDVKRRDMNHYWFIIRRFKNKWDMAAKYPEFADKIIALQPDAKLDLQFELNGYKYANTLKQDDGDLIPVYELRHDKTPALPQGRLVEVMSDEIMTFDGPLPYKGIYTFPVTTGNHFENAFGYSYLMDLMPIQDTLDMTISSWLTNVAANGVQNFQTPKGGAPKVTQVMEGMNVWEFDPALGKIESMDLLRTAPEVPQLADFMIQQGDLISNVSQIGRGNAPSNMSGTAMALLQQQAILSTSGVQTSFTLAQENVGTGMIELLQTFAVVPRIAMIAGKSKRSMVKEFSNKDLKGIGRVFVNRANPLTKTGAGRMEIANNLLQAPPPQPGSYISTPEQYLGVLTTGNLEPLYQRDNSQRMLILAENEDLMEAKQVQGLLTDDDENHILEHSCVLNSPESRENPQVAIATTQHIQWHIDNAKKKDPILAAMLKQNSFFQPPPPPMAPPGAGGNMGPPIPPVMENQTEATNLPNPAQPPNPNAFGGL